MDPLQRIGKVKVKGTSFTISKPNERMKIAPHIYELSNEEERRYLKENFCVCEFEIPTIALERIFVDKVFALEFYWLRRDYMDVSKHAYDLAVLFKEEKIRNFLSRRTELGDVLAYEREEQKARFGGLPCDLQVKNFTVFDGFEKFQLNGDFFNRMQSIYVFDEGDRLDLRNFFPVLRHIQALM